MAHDYTEVSLQDYDLQNWVPSKDVRESAALQLGLDDLTGRQWSTFRKEKNLEATNIRGQWHVRLIDENRECETLIDPELPLTKPNVVHFGDFSSSLAVVNNVSGDALQVHNTTFNTHALASDADRFTSQLEAFTGFLDNTEQMLEQRSRDLAQQTKIKEQSLHQARLKVEQIRQRALQAQKENIALKVQNSVIDAQLEYEITEGKSLAHTLRHLSE